MRCGATDDWAIKKQRVPSLELMEAPGRAVAEAAAEVATTGRAAIVCGKGNNGGDGLVAALGLSEAGFQVDALLLWPPDQLSTDAAAELERLEGGPRGRAGRARRRDARLRGRSSTRCSAPASKARRADPATAAIEAINEAGAPVVAADIASGVDASTGVVAGTAVDADVTVTFHAPKSAIGSIPERPRRRAPGRPRSGSRRSARGARGRIDRPHPRPGAAPGGGLDQVHLGRGPVIGGSRGLTGAVCLASPGRIRAGAGYATVAVPADLEQIFEIRLTEVMSRGTGRRDGRLDAADAEQILVSGPGQAPRGPRLGPGARARPALVAELAPASRGAARHRRRRPQRLRGPARRLAARRAAIDPHPPRGELGRLLGPTPRPSGRGAARERAGGGPERGDRRAQGR